MNRVNLYLLILGMAVVTYIPRALPAVFMDKMHFGRRMDRFLRLIPYTAMAALIFPGVIYSNPDHWETGILGAVTAALLAWRRCPLMVCVLAAIAVDFLLLQFIY